MIGHSTADVKLAFVSPDLRSDSLADVSRGPQGHSHKGQRQPLAAQTDFG